MAARRFPFSASQDPFCGLQVSIRTGEVNAEFPYDAVSAKAQEESRPREVRPKILVYTYIYIYIYVYISYIYIYKYVNT